MIPIFLINYLEWAKIFGLSISLMALYPQFEDVDVRKSLVDLENLGAVASEKALQIDFIHKSSNKNLKTFYLIPWQDITFKKATADDLEIPLQYKFVGVNEFVIVYEKLSFYKELKNKEKRIVELIDNQTEAIFELNENNQVIESESSFSLNEKIHAIKFENHRNYVSVDIDGQYFNPQIKNILLNKFPGKMIQVRMVPDIGAITKYWICPYESNVSECFYENDKLISSSAIKWFELSIENFSAIVLEEVCDSLIDEVNAILLKSESCSEIDKEFIENLFQSLLIIKDKNMEKSLDPFAGYQPKTSPDNVLDYRPSVSDIYNAIPEAKTENIEKLIELFISYESKAESYKGEWIAGNMILGAKPKEYSPSKEELILAEIGVRLFHVLGEFDEKEIKTMFAKNGYEKRMISFKRFSFIHVDVMGSGRFFYVDSIENMEHKLYE